MKRKGFTLIELLAVIVVLAIIALIAVPTVINIINKANKSAFKDSAYGIVKAGELYYSNKLLELNGMESDVVFEFPNNIEGLDIKGSMPSSGKIKVTKEGMVALAVSNGRYCAKKGYKDGDITVDENLEDCKLPKNLNLNITSSDDCTKEETICPVGVKVNVRVNENENYDFYVIGDTGSNLTLIMNRNLGKKVTWISSADYTAAGGTNYGLGGNVEKGPLTALKLLEERTSGWTNIEAKTYTLTDDGGSNLYEPIERVNARARLINKKDLDALGCTATTGSCFDWLVENTSSSNTEEAPLGYWSSYASGSSSAGSIRNNKRVLGNAVHSTSSFGIRPVINISKFAIQ